MKLIIVTGTFHDRCPAREWAVNGKFTVKFGFFLSATLVARSVTIALTTRHVARTIRTHAT